MAQIIPPIDWGFSEKEDHGKIIKTEFTTKFITLNLFRGIRENELIQKNNRGRYVLYNDNFPDKVIWFTQNKRFAEGYADFALLEYPLKAIKHMKIITYEDGFSEDKGIFAESVKAFFDHPEVGIKKGDMIESEVTNDWPILGDIELPPSWFFSYKTQKHIIAKTPIEIRPSMIEYTEEEVLSEGYKNRLQELAGIIKLNV